MEATALTHPMQLKEQTTQANISIYISDQRVEKLETNPFISCFYSGYPLRLRRCGRTVCQNQTD